MNIRRVVKKVTPKIVFRHTERHAHHAESIYYSFKYGNPAKEMRFIGVTGTNGKTTTTNLIYTMLNEAGYKVAILSSTRHGYEGALKDEQEHMTTVPAPLLQKRLREYADAGIEWVVIEVSSHALAQYRTWGIPFEIAVMTNVTHEHLDYHGTLERYKEDKRRLFRLTAKHKNGYGVVYAEDKAAKQFLRTIPAHCSYGIASGDIRANDITLGAQQTTFTATAGDDTYNIKLHMPGMFNVLNALAAIAVGRRLTLTKRQITQGIAALSGVEYRMMPVDEGQAFRVIIDYAGTPDAFEKVFDAVRPTTKGKLIVVFGSPAHRDVAKRPIQGKIAGKYADEVILTEEENRDEPGMNILNDMAVGAEKAGKTRDNNLFLIENRADAIAFAMKRAKNSKDTVIILGKGHEKTIERDGKVYPWNELETTRAAIRSRLEKT